MDLKFILIFFAFTSLTFSQNSFKIVYGIQFEGEFLSEKAKANTELVKNLAGIENFMSKYEFILKYHNGKSVYEVIPIMVFGDEMTVSEETARIFIDYDKKIYTKKELANIIVFQNYNGKNYNVETETKYHDWVLTSETKKINNFTCYKATSKIRNADIIAWYCPEIPISIGPNEYKGLPGLILELSRGKLKYLAKHINLTNKEIVEIPKGENIHEKEFNAILDKSNDIFKIK